MDWRRMKNTNSPGKSIITMWVKIFMQDFNITVSILGGILWQVEEFWVRSQDCWSSAGCLNERQDRTSANIWSQGNTKMSHSEVELLKNSTFISRVFTFLGLNSYCLEMSQGWHWTIWRRLWRKSLITSKHFVSRYNSCWLNYTHIGQAILLWFVGPVHVYD